MTSTRTRVLALGLVLLAGAVACGDDDGGAATDTTGATETPSDTTGAATDTTGGTATTDGTGTTGATDTTGGTDTTGETPTSEPGEANCDATVPGTQIDMGVYFGTAELDPTLTSGGLVGGHEIAAIYDVLFRFDPETNEYVPQLAESMTPNEDFTVWTLKLREGITYSDGTPLTAQLVSDNIDRFFGDGVRNASGAYFVNMESKTAVDDTTLEITLTKPWVEFPFVFADEPGMIVNTNAIGDDPTAFAAQPPDAAGLGPYVVERNAPNEELVLTARQDYWGGPVCVETLRFVFVPGSQATYAAFGNDELDVAFLRDPVVIQEALDAGEESYFAQQDSGAGMLVNNVEGTPTADPRLREAVALAIDTDIVNERVYQGALNTGKTLIQEGSRFYSDGIEEMPTDLDRAAQLVEEAKADGYDGAIRILCSTNPPAPDTATTVEGMLEGVGFDVTVEALDQTEQISAVISGDFDIACWGLNIGPDTGISAMVRNLATGQSRNAYGTPEMDAALDAMLAAEGEEALQAAVAEVNSTYNSDFVSVPFGSIDEGVVWQSDVKGLKPTHATLILFDDAYIEE
jgi:peptide/nickel transport system substrate-binding protein